jgi:flagellar assembly protein FliH
VELHQLDLPPEPVALADAADAAQSLLAAARTETERLREQAVADGHRAGAEQARLEAAAALQPALAALAAAADRLAELQAEAAGRAETRATELALAVAEKIVAGALDVQPERVLDVVRGALRGMLDHGRVVVCVHPDDAELVRGAVEGAGHGLGALGQVEVHEERRVARGGALVRTSEGEIDATAAAKLERARELIATELGR